MIEVIQEEMDELKSKLVEIEQALVKLLVPR
jgi:protein subunit release factor A